MMLLRNILFYIGIIPALLFFFGWGFAFFWSPVLWRYRIMSTWSRFFIFWAKVTCGLKYQIEGLNNLPKENAIVFANHQSTWETMFFQVLLPPQCWVIKKELLYIPVFGWGLALLDPISIQRKDLFSIKVLLREGIKRLRTGRWVIIFPEGTRVPVGETKAFSRTAAALSHASKKPLVPIAHNAGEFWPKGMMIRKPGTIRVAIGPFIDPHNKKVTEIHELAEDWVRKGTSSAHF